MTIDHKTLEYLAGLGKIRIDKNEEAKLLNDLRKILAYFDELKEVDTEGVEPLAGGTVDVNVFREDDSTRINADSNADKRGYGISDNQRKSALVGQFPEEKKGFLKVPPVFE